jgi:ActR/RegA family two-component response regulator
MATILILDDDLGFVLWLGQTLASPEFRPFPALSVAEAKKLIRQLSAGVDILIVNPELKGAVGFARDLRKQQRQLRLIASLGYSPDASEAPADFDAARNKPDERDEAEQAAWQHLVRRIFSRPASAKGS